MEPRTETFQKIVVGVDLSPPSLVALGQAMNLARLAGAPLVMMMIEPDPGAPELVTGALTTSEERRRSVELTRFAADRAEIEELRQRLVGQGVEVSHIVTDGDVDSGLADGAVRIGADLVVVGTHGHRGLRRMLLGSVAERTVRLASCSVLVARARPTKAEGGYRRIVVGTDFSPLAERAIARAVTVAAKDAVIEVTHAWQVPYDFSPDGVTTLALPEMRDALIADSARAGAELQATWRARGVNLEFHAVQSTPRESLCERAEAVDADLVVVGSHGRRGLRRYVLGSVAEATVRHAPCSVMVAR